MNRPAIIVAVLMVSASAAVAVVWVGSRNDVAVPSSVAAGQSLSKEEAVELAEQFVRENGYTDASEREIKRQLDLESIEWSNDRRDLLEERRATLAATAIGVKSTRDGWGVAFDYVQSSGACRVVTMMVDGSDIRMQHQDGIREYWLGFD
jgi:opacity protein-like surface antigen